MARTERAKRAAIVARASTGATKRAAQAVIKAEKEAQKVAKTGGLEALREQRTEAMETRAERFKGRKKITDKPAKGAPTLADTIAAANEARAYADAMRRITGREKGVGTPYTGGGLVREDDGDIDRATQAAFEDVRFMEGPTDAQLANIDWMLREGEGATVRDKRADWREQVWGDTWNPATGMYDRGDRTAALATQAGLLNQPVPDIYNTNYNKYFSDLNNTLNRTQGTSAFQHPYAADPYKVPHMETGGLWEGLGAEYQPGTVEGLGLLAGRAYAPYEPLRQGLLNARPDFMGTPSGFTPMNFEGGLEGSTDTTNTTTTTTSTDDQTAAMNRLYAAANKAGNWGNVTFGSYPAGQQSWFYGPRGGDMSYTYGGDPYSYTQIMAGEHIK